MYSINLNIYVLVGQHLALSGLCSIVTLDPIQVIIIIFLEHNTQQECDIANFPNDGMTATDNDIKHIQFFNTTGMYDVD